MKLLLDTNALIWLIGQADGRSLGPQARQSIENADEVYVSSVSVLEIRIKTMLGKLSSADDLVADITAAGLKSLSFDTAHADAISNFPTLNRHDPFERMLIAQAQIEEMTLLTSDTVLLNLGLSFTANARE